MPYRGFVFVCRRFAGAIVLATGLWSAALAGASPAPAASATLIEQRMLAQQGLAIPFGLAVMQTQLVLFTALVVPFTDCTPVNGGGSVKATGRKSEEGVITGTVTIYFDDACSAIYLQARVRMVAKDGGTRFDFTETVTYRSRGGKVVGTLSLNMVAAQGTTFDAKGTGLFKPANGAPVVRFGLLCSFPSDPSDATTCTGGVAQRFKAPLNIDLGSVTPLGIRQTRSGTIIRAALSSPKASLFKGLPGKLRVSLSPASVPRVTGGSVYGADRVTGTHANFVLFPPPRTTWTVTDRPRNAKFTMSIDAGRRYTGAITRISDGAKLASISVDQSGTGSITYSDRARAAVSSWTLAN